MGYTVVMTTEKFPTTVLSDSFTAHTLREGQVGDVLVTFPKNREPPEFRILATEEEVLHLKEEEIKNAKGSFAEGRSRSAIIRATGNISTSFFVTWANIPQNRKSAQMRIYGYGRLFERNVEMAKHILELNIPTPTPEQHEEISSVLNALQSGEELIEKMRDLLNTSEKMTAAIRHQLMSGKIDKNTAKEHMRGLLLGLGIKKPEPSEKNAKETSEPPRKSKQTP